MAITGNVCIYEICFNENALNLIKDSKSQWFLHFTNFVEGPFFFFHHLEISFAYAANGN